MDFIRLASVQIHLSRAPMFLCRRLTRNPQEARWGFSYQRVSQRPFCCRPRVPPSEFAEAERSPWAGYTLLVLCVACCELRNSNVKRRPELRGGDPAQKVKITQEGTHGGGGFAELKVA